MRTYSFHEVIDHIILAKSFAKTKFYLTGLPDQATLLPFLRGEIRKKFRAPIVLYKHLLFVLSIFQKSRECDLIFAREFLVLPLICFVWLALPLRKKVCFIVVHNLQKAFEYRVQRVAFTLLCKMKFRLAFLDGMDGLQELGISMAPDQCLYIPHVVVPVQGRKAPNPQQKKRVGIVGSYRPEKGIDKLIPYLTAVQQKIDVDIMIGTPNYTDLKSHLESFDNTIEIIDTSSGEDYAAALLKCDVILLNYNREQYYYRGSGVITNAVECGASVVCPDYPIFRKQVLNPVPVGGLFEAESKIVETTIAVLADREKLYANIEAYSSIRTPQAIAKYIDDFARLNCLC
jgi:glycosyltransferase involved in cell wall biosynthesis